MHKVLPSLTIAAEIIHASALLPRISILLRNEKKFVEKLATHLLSSAELILFFLGNFIKLYQTTTGSTTLKPIVIKRSGATESTSLNISLSAYVSCVSILLEKIKSLVGSCKNTSRHKIYHLLFQWYSGTGVKSILSQEKLFDALFARQISLLYSPSNIPSILSEFCDTSSASLKKDPLALVESSEKASIYLNLISLFPTYRIRVCQSLAYTPNLCRGMWFILKPLARVLISAIVSDISTEPSLPILHLFSLVFALLFQTLDDDEIYVAGAPFTLPDYTSIAEFFADILFSVHLVPDRSGFGDVSLLFQMIHDRHSRRYFCPDVKNDWLVKNDRKTFRKGILYAVLDLPADSEERKSAISILSHIP
jgi:hypothetical protein